MTKQEVKPAEELNKLMQQYGFLSVAKVAELTGSCTRSVKRWQQTGIPLIKWDLLNFKLNKHA